MLNCVPSSTLPLVYFQKNFQKTSVQSYTLTSLIFETVKPYKTSLRDAHQIYSHKQNVASDKNLDNRFGIGVGHRSWGRTPVCGKSFFFLWVFLTLADLL